VDLFTASIDTDTRLRVAIQASGMIHANIGPGPFMTELFGLRQDFGMSMVEDNMTPELLAGLYEGTTGALERKGMVKLLKCMHGLGNLVLMARSVERELPLSDFLGKLSPGREFFVSRSAVGWPSTTFWTETWGMF
jgi:hypothetical protein